MRAERVGRYLFITDEAVEFDRITEEAGMVDVAKHNAAAARKVVITPERVAQLERAHERCLPIIDMLMPDERTKLLNKLLKTYGVRRDELDV